MPTDRPYRTTSLLSEYVGEEDPQNDIWGHPVRYLSETERNSFLLTFRAGKVCDGDGNPFDTTAAATLHSGAGRAIFVMDAHGNFYASKYQAVGEFHHSSLVAGAPVAAAGEVEVRSGVLKAPSDKSGHYRPTRSFTNQAIDQLRTNGVDLQGVRLDFVGGSD